MSPTFLNISSVPWFLIAFALIPGVLFSKRISAEVNRKDFINQIVFSLVAVGISFFQWSHYR